jgi:hypothetical protein
MLMDLLGVAGIGVLGYLVYTACRTDRRMCGLGGLGIVLILLAYIGRYIDIDRSLAVFIVLIAVVVAVGILSGRL